MHIKKKYAADIKFHKNEVNFNEFHENKDRKGPTLM